MPSTKATVTNDNPKFPPKLTEGKVTVEILRDFSEAVEGYVKRQKIPPESVVEEIWDSFKSVKLRTWLRPRKDDFIALPFAAFITKIREKLLGADWAAVHARKVRARQQGATESFDDFSTAVRELNDLLLDSPHHLDDDTLRTQLIAQSLEELSTLYNKDEDKLNEIEDFDDWVDAVIEIDAERIAANNRTEATLRRILAEQAAATAAKRPASNLPPSDRDSKRARKENIPSAVIPPSARLPPLDPSERLLLENNSGCTKCRRVFVTHTHRDCPNNFPDAATYRTLTQKDVDDARSRSSSKPPVKTESRTPRAPKAVNAVLRNITDMDSDSESWSDGDREVSPSFSDIGTRS